MSSLDDYRQDAKNRYTLALQEYTKTCMGRPLEKLAVSSFDFLFFIYYCL